MRHLRERVALVFNLFDLFHSLFCAGGKESLGDTAVHIVVPFHTTQVWHVVLSQFDYCACLIVSPLCAILGRVRRGRVIRVCCHGKMPMHEGRETSARACNSSSHNFADGREKGEMARCVTSWFTLGKWPR